MTARQIFDRGGTAIGLVAVAIVFAILLGPRFFDPSNLDLMARQTAIVCMAAIGATVVIVAGGIDLSVGSIVALGSVVVALRLRAGAGPVDAALSAVAAGALCGLLNGVLITQLRLVPFIVTLGTMLLVRGAAKGMADERRIEAPITWLNDLLRAPRVAYDVPAGIWLLAVLALIVAGILRYTAFGRHVFAIGSNERTARLCGVAIAPTKVVVYTLAGVFGGLAGLLQFSRLSVGDPTVAVGLELDVIAAVIIGGGSLAGGRGTISGTIMGAAIMTIIAIGCSQKGLANWTQQMVTGSIIITAVALDRMRVGRTEPLHGM